MWQCSVDKGNPGTPSRRGGRARRASNACCSLSTTGSGRSASAAGSGTRRTLNRRSGPGHRRDQDDQATQRSDRGQGVVTASVAEPKWRLGHHGNRSRGPEVVPLVVGDRPSSRYSRKAFAHPCPPSAGEKKNQHVAFSHIVLKTWRIASLFGMRTRLRGEKCRKGTHFCCNAQLSLGQNLLYVQGRFERNVLADSVV